MEHGDIVARKDLLGRNVPPYIGNGFEFVCDAGDSCGNDTEILSEHEK